MTNVVRRLVRPAVLGVIAAAFIVSPVAWASHTLTITHQPPPAGKAGAPLVLTVRTGSDCTSISNECGDIVVTATYSVNGTTKSVSATGGVANLTIPGADVQSPNFTYTITASQEECAGIGGCTLDCHTATATAGPYTVPVPA